MNKKAEQKNNNKNNKNSRRLKWNSAEVGKEEWRKIKLEIWKKGGRRGRKRKESGRGNKERYKENIDKIMSRKK